MINVRYKNVKDKKDTWKFIFNTENINMGQIERMIKIILLFNKENLFTSR